MLTSHHTIKNILHIEDQFEDAKIVEYLLRPSDNPEAPTITHKPTLSEGVQILSDDFDAVLLDLDLGDNMGLSNIAHIKEKCPNVPIIVLSGNNSENIAYHSIKNGAQEYIHKNNIDTETIYCALLSSILRQKQQYGNMAHIDPVTGMPMMQLFNKKLRTILCTKNDIASMIFINIDNFTNILGEYGYDIVNEAVRELSRRIQTVVGDEIYSARYNDSQMSILLSSEKPLSSKDIHALCHDINVSINRPLYIEKIKNCLDIVLSIGGLYNLSGDNLSEGCILPIAQSTIVEAQNHKTGRKLHVRPY